MFVESYTKHCAVGLKTLSCGPAMSLTAIIAISCLIFGCSESEPTTPSGGMVHAYSLQRVEDELNSAGYKDVAIVDCSRNDEADGLIVRGTWTQPGGCAWIVRKGVVQQIRCPDGIPYVDENGKIIGWTSSDAVVLVNGVRLPFERMKRYVSLDSSGKYFLIDEERNGAWHSWVGRIGQEEKRLWMCDVSCAILRRVNRKLFVFGRDEAPVCFVLDEGASGLEFERRIDVKGGFIDDVDTSGNSLLIHRDGAPFSALLVYDIQTGKYKKSRLLPGSWNVFLREDPFARTNGLAVANENSQTNQQR